MSTDAELLQRYARGNSQAAFTELVERHLGLVYSTALRQLAGDSHLAQDVAQTVFTDLARKASALSGRTTLAGWLYLGAHHAAAQAVRTDRRRRTREQEAHAMHELLPETPTGDWDRVRPVIDEALRDLSATDREAVLLRFFEQQPFGKVGTALNLSEDAARMRVERALEKLRVLLGRRGVTSTSTALATVLTQQTVFATPAGLASAITSAALTHAGTIGGANAAANFFMSTPVVVSTAIALAAVCGIVYQSNRIHAVETQVAAVRRERDALQSKLRESQQRGAQITQQLAQTEERAAAARLQAASPAPLTAPPTNTSAAFTSKVGMLTLKASDGTVHESLAVPITPEGRRAMLRDAIDARYPALYRKLGWTDAQREQFKQLMVERKEAGDRMFEAAFKQGMPADREFSRGVTDQITTDTNVKLRAMFGDATFDVIQYFENTIPLRNIADQLAKALFYSDTPLAPAQAEQLIDVMAANAGSAPGRFDLGVLTLNSEAMFAQAQGVLSTPQLAKLRELEAQRLEQKRLRENFDAAQSAINPPTTPKPPGS